MNAAVICIAGLLLFYFVGYRVYSQYLSEKVFGLTADETTPAHDPDLRDDIDYTPTNGHVLWGHHFTSIAGAAPIIGPAVAVIWGWVPALFWVVLGTMFMGAAHDFGALALSARRRGTSMGDLTGDIIHPRTRILFQIIIYFLIWVVAAVFAFAIGRLFTNYPATVIPVNFEILIALGIGILFFKYRWRILAPSIAALLMLYAMIAVGIKYPVAMYRVLVSSAVVEAVDDAVAAGAVTGYGLVETPDDVYAVGTRVTRTQVDARNEQRAMAHLPKLGVHWFEPAVPGSMAKFFEWRAETGHPEATAVATELNDATYDSIVAWGVLLLGYAFIASTLPVWLLLQPRDYINSHQLIVGLSGLVLGLLIVHPEITAPALNPEPVGAPPLFPLIFVTIACGAISGFHGLVSSGTTSKQLDRMPQARTIGYGGMLGEGSLALIATLAVAAGLGSAEEWGVHYASWAHASSGANAIASFVDGASSFLTGGLAIPLAWAQAVVAVLVISFAATSLDTGVRIQRYVVGELGKAVGVSGLGNRYLGGLIAVVPAAILLLAGQKVWGPLWLLFGTTNQLVAGMTLLVLVVYLYRSQKPRVAYLIPMVFVLLVTTGAMLYNLYAWVVTQGLAGSLWVTAGVGGLILVLELWVIAEAVVVIRRITTNSDSPASAPA